MGLYFLNCAEYYTIALSSTRSDRLDRRVHSRIAFVMHRKIFHDVQSIRPRGPAQPRRCAVVQRISLFPSGNSSFAQPRTAPAVTYIVGENGSGKSTLLEAIAVAWGLNPEGGSRNFYFETRASHSELKRFITLVKGVRQPSDSFFSAPRAISTSLRKSKDAMPKASAAESSTTTAAARCTNNPTASRLWRSFSTASSARDCTYSMNPKPRSRRRASSPS